MACSTRYRGLPAILLTLLLLTACADQRRNLDLLVNGPPSSFDPAQAERYQRSQSAVIEAISRHAGFADGIPQDGRWAEFVRAAFDIADAQCEDYMSALRRLDIARRQSVRQTNLLGGATAAILGLTQVASAAIAITAVAFGLVEATIDNYAGGLLYELPPSAVRQLVDNTRTAYEAQLTAANWTDRTSSFRTIRGYVELCLPSVIESQVATAIGRAPATASAGQSPLGRRIRVTVGDTAAPAPALPTGSGVNRSAAQPIIIPARPAAVPDARSAIEQSLTASQVRDIQARLCMSSLDGTLRAATREAIASYRLIHRVSPPADPATAPLTRQEVDDLLAMRDPCPRQYRSYYEWSILREDRVATEALQRRLNERPPADGQIPLTGILDEATRGRLAVLFPEARGQITPAVLESLSR